MQSRELKEDIFLLNNQMENKNFQLLEKIIKYNDIDKFDIGNAKLNLMSTHPFKYLRGTAERFFDIFFESLKYNSKEFSCLFKNKDLVTACTNDTHVGNFGFTGKNSVFITNDFDEYMIGNPFTDLLRYTSSLKFFVDDINHKISKNNLELRTLKNLKNEFENLSKKELIDIYENSNLFDEISKLDIEEVEKFNNSELKLYINELIDEGIKNRIEVNEYIDSEKLENIFLKKYFESIQNEKSIVFDKKSKMYKFFKKSKNKENRKNQLLKYTKKCESRGLIFNLENEKIITFNSNKKAKLLKLLEQNINSNLLIKDIIKRKTAGVGSSHLSRYYILVQSKKTKNYNILEMKEQLKPVSLNFKKEFLEYFDINLLEFEKTEPAQIHVNGIKLILEDSFDENIGSLKYKGKSFILKTHFDSKQGFDETKIFKYSKKKKDLTKFLDEYILCTAQALANSHVNGLKIRIKNLNSKNNSEYLKIKKSFKEIMNKYRNDENIYSFLKTMSKNISNDIFEEYLLFSQEFNVYQGYIKGQIKTKIILNKDIDLDEIIGVLKFIIYSPDYNSILHNSSNSTYRKLYNLIDNKKYKVEDRTFNDYFKQKKFKLTIIDLINIYLSKEEAFISLKNKHKLEVEFLKKLKSLDDIFESRK